MPDPRGLYVCSFKSAEGQRLYVSGFASGRWSYHWNTLQARPVSGLLARQFVLDHQDFTWAIQQVPAIVRLDHSGELVKVYRFHGMTEASCRHGTIVHYDGLRPTLTLNAHSQSFNTWEAALKFLDRHIARSKRGG